MMTFPQSAVQMLQSQMQRNRAAYWYFTYGPGKPKPVATILARRRRVDRPPVVLQLRSGFAVAVWQRDEDGQAIYGIKYGAPDAGAAVALARNERQGADRRPG